MYWKKWHIWFEQNELEITIIEEYADKEGFLDEKDIFRCVISFIKNISYDRIFGTTEFDVFLEDAFNFRKYNTKDLCDVETEIEVWDRHELG